MRQHPFWTLLDFVVFLAFFHAAFDDIEHGLLDRHEPLFDLGRFGIHFAEETNIFAFGTDHPVDHHRFGMFQLQVVNIVETLLDVLVDSVQIFGLGKDFEQLIIGQEVETGKRVPFLFQIILQSFLDGIERFLVFFELQLGLPFIVDHIVNIWFQIGFFHD